MTFEQAYERWLEKALASDIPTDIKGFCFVLFECAGVTEFKFGVNLIGTNVFDRHDDDWACDPHWLPERSDILIPVAYSSDQWETCLDRMLQLVRQLFSSTSASVQKLKSSQGVGLCFCDGDMHLLWVRNPA